MKPLLSLLVIVVGTLPGLAQEKPKPPQYKFGEIAIPAASAAEPVREGVSLKAALKYLEDGAKAWSGSRKCVTCHTNGTYMALRPALTKRLGPPSKQMRDFFVARLAKWRKTEKTVLTKGLQPTKLAYIAAGLAEWDRHVTGKLSMETDAALRLMLSAQSKDGSQRNLDCWPPYESSSYHGATVAAMAISTAPGWEKSLDPKKDKAVRQQVAKLHGYLKKTQPPHDYARVLLLWTATRRPGLVDAKRKRQLIETVFKHQQNDGGWSIRTFSTPEKWGRGNRAKKLRGEPDFNTPASDGHMTGLAVLVLRESGIPASDARIQKAVKWLQTHQRQSGRWWTRSLNTDRYHFITYSGTLFPIAALAKCDALPK